MIAEILAPPARQEIAARKIDIEFLFLDLNTCTRCVGTGKNLETALKAVEQVLGFMDVELNLKKILVSSEEQARQLGFVTSPTIRVNGQDIAFEIKESKCDSCTDLCGCQESTDCRIWLYRGQEYTEAPVPMIVEAVLQELFSTPQQPVKATPEYGAVPENLQRFFTGKAEMMAGASACCSTAEQQSCCEPSAKASCCGGASEPGSCSCK